MSVAIPPRSSVPVAQAGLRAPGTLALAFQEPITAAVRLRTNRQAVVDAAAFRLHLKQLLGAADAEARRAGHTAESVRLAVFAVVAFMDESVLNSTLPVFGDWARQPLQEEVFGEHTAGETFYRHLQELLGRQDSAEVAEVLEVFLLCLLLGFRGRYATAEGDGRPALVAAAREKVRRIRGEGEPISSAWELPTNDVVVALRDPWTPRLAVLAGGSTLLAGALFLIFRFWLGGWTADLHALAMQIMR